MGTAIRYTKTSEGRSGKNTRDRAQLVHGDDRLRFERSKDTLEGEVVYAGGGAPVVAVNEEGEAAHVGEFGGTE